MRAVKGQIRLCSVCGKAGHRMETCAHPAAKTIRELKAKLLMARKKKPQATRRKPTAKPPPKSTKYKARAMKLYTKKPDALCHKKKNATGHGRSPSDSTDETNMLALCASAGDALAGIRKVGFVTLNGATRCPFCQELYRTSAKPVERPGPGYQGHLYARCEAWLCTQWANVLHFSPFAGMTGLTLRQLAYTLRLYLNYDCIPPSACDIATTLKVGYKAVGKVLDIVRQEEARLGREETESGEVDGDVEVDGHCLRTFYASVTGPYADLIPDRLKNVHDAVVIHVRILGVRKRGGIRTWIRVAPFRPVAPGARPPPECTEEIVTSGILSHVKPGSSAMYADGAKAWPTAAKQIGLRIKTVQVAHSRMEFTRKVPFFKTGHSTQGGTMSIDSKWTAFERLIPSTVHTKKGSVVNEKLYTYLYAAVYRLNHKGEDGFKLVGAQVASRMAEDTLG